MKRTLLGLALAALVFHGVVWAQVQAPSQEIQQPVWESERVTVDVQNGHLPEILAVLEKAGRFTFQINGDLKLRLDQPVTMRYRDARLDDIVHLALNTAGLTYKIIDDKTVQVVER